MVLVKDASKIILVPINVIKKVVLYFKQPCKDSVNNRIISYRVALLVFGIIVMIGQVSIVMKCLMQIPTASQEPQRARFRHPAYLFTCDLIDLDQYILLGLVIAKLLHILLPQLTVLSRSTIVVKSKFLWRFCVVMLRFGFVCGCRGFCHTTESILFLFSLYIYIELTKPSTRHHHSCFYFEVI